MPFYGGSVAGGYAQGLQANQQAAVRDAQLKAYLQQLAQQKTLYDQQQALRTRQTAAEMEVGPRVRDWALSQQPQVQPPGPGQSSPGGTPNGGPPPQVQQQLQAPPPGQADQAMQMGANPGAPIGPPPAPAPQAGVPPQPDSWKGIPKPPPGAPLGASSYYQMAPIESPPKDQAAAMRTDSGMIPISNKLLVDMAKDWKEKGLNGQQIMDQYKIVAPMMNSEQKQQLAQMRYALDIQTKVNAYQEKLIADARADKSLQLREKEVTSLDENRKEMRAQGQQRISIAKQRLNVQVANAAGGKANLKSVEYIYPKGEDGEPDQSQPPIGTRGVTKSGKIIQLDIEGNTLNPRAAGGGTAKEGAALAAKGQKSITNLKEDRRVLIAAGTPLSDPRVKALDDKISAMEKGGQGGGAPKKKVGDIVPVNGKLYKVTGFDKDGEPLVVPAQ